MEQGTLWELDKKADWLANPTWGQLDPAVKAEVLGKLSVLMVKAVRHDHGPVPSEKENDDE